MKYRMLKKGEWIYQSKGDEFRVFVAKDTDKWALTVNGDEEERITDADVGYYRRPIPEPKRKARPISIFGKMDYPKRRAKMIVVDGHREQIKPVKMPMPKGCNICPLESICKMVGWSSKRCTRALRKAWTWAGGGKG